MSVCRQIGLDLNAQDSLNAVLVAEPVMGYTMAVAIDAFGQIVDVAPPGHAVPLSWQPGAGASKVQVETASLRIGPAALEEPDTALSKRNSGKHKIITIPKGKRVRTLKLHGLKGRQDLNPPAGYETLTNESDLVNNGLRLLVSLPDSEGVFTPVQAVPKVGAKDVFPASLAGAHFQNSVLSFDTLVNAESIRLSLVKSGFPEETSSINMKLDRVTGTYAAISNDLEIISPNGNIIGSFPGEFPLLASPLDFDLRLAVEEAFNSAISNNRDLNAEFRLQGLAPGVAQVKLNPPKGFLIREFPGITSSQLQGEPQELTLNLTDPLAAEQPAQVTADLTVSYTGIRILQSASNEMPATSGELNVLRGIIVKSEPVIRSILPGQLNGLPIARVGLIGRAPEETEISLKIVELTGKTPRKDISEPVVLKKQVQTEIGITWFDIPELEWPKAPIGLSVRANSGRFFWVKGDDMLVRIAVHDPTPPSKTLFLHGHSVFTSRQFPAGQNQLHLPAMSLPGQAFQTKPPVLASELFLNVDFSDITLRYAR